MAEDILITEARYVYAIEQEYLSKGYEVSREVKLDFLPGFCADLVVRKDDETKVVEVKSRTSLANDSRTATLSKVLESKPGWSFELVLVPEPERLSSHKHVRPFNLSDTYQRLGEAERALEAGFTEAATLLAWSACESMVRILLRAEGVLINRLTNSSYTIGKAVSEGAISLDDYHYLEEAQRYRNEIVHGFRGDDFDGECLVKSLIEMTHRLSNETLVPESGWIET